MNVKNHLRRKVQVCCYGSNIFFVKLVGLKIDFFRIVYSE